MTQLPELLAPAGSPKAFEAALLAGADAIYVGGPLFNARINATNFSNEELSHYLNLAHSKGVKVYITLNTLILEKEYKQVLSYVSFLRDIGVDALIVADLGIASEIKENFPDIELHASTQCGVHNKEGVLTLSKLGFSRVVAARELSKENIDELIQTNIQIEMFVHGALCVSHSGQCLFSSLVGGRSGNRGECAQPCRLSYNNEYPLSLKDYCLAEHVQTIIASKVSSLKIEGRMKSPQYVYTVTSYWRKFLDNNINADKNDIKTLSDIFSRSGFTDAYYTSNISSKMNGIRSEADKNTTYKSAKQFKEILCNNRLPIPQKSIEHITPSLHSPNCKISNNYYKTARFYNPDAVPKNHPFTIVYTPLEKFDGKNSNGVIVPSVIFDSEISNIKSLLEQAVNNGAEYALVGNIGHIELVKSYNLKICADFRLGAYSAKTAEVLYNLGCNDIIFSPELTIPQLRDIQSSKGVVIYGRIPLMLLEKRINYKTLIDRKGVKFPVIYENGRNIILNSMTTYMADKKSDIKKAKITNEHFIFTTESQKEVCDIINAYKNEKTTNNKNIRRIKA